MQLSELAANAGLDAQTALLNGGSLCLYDANGAIIAELTLAYPAFHPAKGGQAVAKAQGRSNPASVTGAPARFVARGPDGDAVHSGNIGEDLQLDRATIEKGASIYVTDWSIRQPYGDGATT